MTIEQQILKQLNDIPIIDAHEHLITEEEHIDRLYNFMDIFYPYVQVDMVASGLDLNSLIKEPKNDQETIHNWQLVKPFWERVKYGSYALQVKRTMKAYFGITSLNDQTVIELGDRMNATRRKGHYRHILQEIGNVELVLNQALNVREAYAYKEDFFLGHQLAWYLVDDQALDAYIGEDADISLQTVLGKIRSKLQNAKESGAVLVKYGAAQFHSDYQMSEVEKEFDLYKRGIKANMVHLRVYLLHQSIGIAGDLGLVAAFHTGVWDNVMYRHPGILFKLVEAYPSTTFDVYHMGIPFVREAAFLAKNYANVYMNLCWSHIVSDTMLINSLNEWLDLIPVHKFIAYGGDHNCIVEHVLTHLELAKENLAKVFAKRVEMNKMTVDEAVVIIKQWFYDNPKRIYNL